MLASARFAAVRCSPSSSLLLTKSTAATAPTAATTAAAIAVRHYHEKVIDHYERPRNVGSLNKNSKFVGTGLVGAPACGDVMKTPMERSLTPLSRHSDVDRPSLARLLPPSGSRERRWTRPHSSRTLKLPSSSTFLLSSCTAPCLLKTQSRLQFRTFERNKSPLPNLVQLFFFFFFFFSLTFFHAFFSFLSTLFRF
ncbi:NifU-like protein [Capsaspora owczarzaki ATCC 30864]|uniref:NifU-like protein n=1 Tax=Capsaspora owczarzaki (strain ATCC 30864) TaxID=595528 RepID=A0A0D2WQ27_CAPO3|nr:NifU-like protein [Capsaspora owczarzaki ATCC 30864]KJE92978.1 NifU-like protein [Capsaspora owczarzaki ATCC 30864]|eukprot:XP_004363574.2 NifU-like protein [Capsaspora owczarzaki ATCC 30864]